MKWGSHGLKRTRIRPGDVAVGRTAQGCAISERKKFHGLHTVGGWCGYSAVEFSGSDCDGHDSRGIGRGKYGCAETIGSVFGDCGEDGGDFVRGGRPETGAAICYRTWRSRG